MSDGKVAALRNAAATAAQVAELDRCAKDAKSARGQRRLAMRRAADAGATYAEIASACECSLGTVKAEVARARGKTWMLKGYAVDG